MIDRSVLLVAAVGAVGTTLVLSELRRFRRVPMLERLRPYAPASTTMGRSRRLSAGSFSEVVGPLAAWIGDIASTALRMDDDIAARLERIHSPLAATTFRVRQMGSAMMAGLAACALALVVGTPAPFTALLLFGAPTLAFLVHEQRLASASAKWQRGVFLELPVVTEQLGMLLSAGFSLGAALNRLSERGSGCISADLRRVCARVRYGAAEIQALREWAELARVDGLDRLVSILALNHEAGDLGRLIAEEARNIRRDAQRELIETIERRAQLVWIPVTVAALLPGTLFLVVPFLEAMRLFTNP